MMAPRAIAQGSAYVFVRSWTAWSQQQKLTASDAAAGDLFGHSVAISGETVVVGAPFDDIGAAGSDQGSAYVFVRSGAIWSEQQKLEPRDAREVTVRPLGGDQRRYGRGRRSRFMMRHGLQRDQGSAYVFVRSGGRPGASSRS